MKSDRDEAFQVFLRKLGNPKTGWDSVRILLNSTQLTPLEGIRCIETLMKRKDNIPRQVMETLLLRVRNV